MDAISDSDDSAFLFSANVPKRKGESNVGNNLKKVKLNSQRDGATDDVQRDEELRTGTDSVHINNKILESVAEVSISNERLVGDIDAMEKPVPQKVDTQFSCPLCLKILQSESTHFAHMKQCAKKSKMSVKQLLETLQLHKQHLKERLSAGLSNVPTKKKKINVQKRAEDSTYQLAVGLALSKSLEDTGAGKENENFTDDVNSHTGNTTLEKFGFTSFGKPVSGMGKKSKNSKIVNSILKKRTNEEREKILTEKASVILLINDTMRTDMQESLRIYHCKHLEETWNEASHLWNLGENIEETQWYVKNLKSIILEENTEPEDSRNITSEKCNIDEEIKELNLPKTTIFEDWRRLINNKHLSDLTLDTKDEETVYLHAVVLYARCPTILESDLKTIIHKFEKWIILKFLQYLYCGTLDGLVREEIEDLFRLAQSLGYQELLDVLNCLKNSLSRKTYSGIERHTREIDSGCEWGRARVSRSVLSHGNRRDTDDECNDVSELCHHDTEEQSRMDVSDRIEPSESLKTSSDGETCNIEEDHSEMDMFEEAENLNRSMNEKNGIPENDPECIEISSGSVKGDVTQTGTIENEKILSDMDYEIPYFDPYEHFNSDIPDTEPYAGSEIQSQSLIVGEISPVKSGTRKTSSLDNLSTWAGVPECCSTPNQLSQPSTSAQAEFPSCKRSVKRRRYATPCSKINRKSGRLFASKSWKKGNFVERKGKISPDEEDSDKVACIVTESILKQLDNSFGTTPKEEQNYVEVTPTVPNEEFIEDVSPLPDYSVMGASSIKKHLTKYGLKKSLSKNKAKKILRHIYEELHPILNMKNGKIVKCIQSDKQMRRRERKVGNKSTGRKKLTPTITEKGKNEAEWTLSETPTKKRSCTSPKTAVDEDPQSCTSSDGESASNSLSDGSCFEVEEPSSQSAYTSATDTATAIYDFIHNNPDIHRQVLLYKPIWLEDLQRKLFEKYNKKFKLADLMDCLDAECVTFRCESQRRKNNRR